MKEEEMLVLPNFVKHIGDELMSLKIRQGHVMLKEWQDISFDLELLGICPKKFHKCLQKYMYKDIHCHSVYKFGNKLNTASKRAAK